MVKLEVTRISFGPTLKPSHFACVRWFKTAILADDPLWLHSIDITDIPLSTYIYITYIYIYVYYIYIYIYICISIQSVRHGGLQATLSTAAPHL